MKTNIVREALELLRSAALNNEAPTGADDLAEQALAALDAMQSVDVESLVKQYGDENCGCGNTNGCQVYGQAHGFAEWLSKCGLLGIPEGYALVPKIATEDMRYAGIKALNLSPSSKHSHLAVEFAWRDMLRAAAPQGEAR